MSAAVKPLPPEWSEAEIALLRAHYPAGGARAVIAAGVGRTTSAIGSKARALGLRVGSPAGGFAGRPVMGAGKGRPWTHEDNLDVKAHYPSGGAGACRVACRGRTAKAVDLHARVALGLKREPGSVPVVAPAAPSAVRVPKRAAPGGAEYTRRAVEWARRSVDAPEGEVGLLQRQAGERFLADLDRADAEWSYDAAAAEAFCTWFERLVPPSGEQFGDHLALQEWQVFLFCNTHGFRLRADPPAPGLARARRFREANLIIARKAGKTTSAAAEALYDLTAAGRRGSLQVLAAATQLQAQVAMTAAVGIASQTHWLQDEYGLKVRTKMIRRDSEVGSGVMEAYASSVNSLHGKRPTLVILDEGAQVVNISMLGVYTTALGSTYSPMLLLPTTAGEELESVGQTKRALVGDILAGESDLDSVFGLAFEPPQDSDPYDPATWRMANPALGSIVSEEFYRTEAEMAKRDPAAEQLFVTTLCNLWRASRIDRWIDREQWDGCILDTPAEELRQLPCWVGIDGSEVDDLFAVCFLFQRPDGNIHARWRTFCPGFTLQEREQRGMRQYYGWSAAGHITACGQYRIELADIAEVLNEFDRTHNLQGVIADQFTGVQDLRARLLPEVAGKFLSIHKRADAVTESCRDLQARFHAPGSGGLTVESNPVARWCAENVHVERRRDETLLPIKKNRNSEGKIDLIDALVFANALRLTPGVGREVEVVAPPIDLSTARIISV